MAENKEGQEITDDQVQENSENLAEETAAETPATESTETEDKQALLENQLAEAKDKYLRLYAEFENFRRRTAKEKIETIQNASEGLIKELIPVIDDFERANKSFETVTEIEPLKEGISLIFNKLQKTLAAKGLKPMEAKDQVFDAELHECITQFAAGDDKKGLVIDEVEKGYFLNDKVIRYAKVVVGS
ncbi:MULTISPECIES: nucleotide exchange factor GrpE [Emticicia]|uniref:nucleotide exchange factor GrpE n=1 Tax=Emticicia TaxID=312278 RepID=UPI000C75E286|nr:MULTISPECIES: nucleotide exchange factor GrpE [Emticicia]PLK45472.1 nucleotide exchange factor GrpE [Emticicia sp. TH156]UTA69571.1 nucleotide exchange factor GrpE [Emticicia sp. 21SJ11W-3]